MANTDSLVAVTQYWVDKITASRAALGIPVVTDVVNVFYGDQDSVSAVPTICVEPNDKRRTLNGVRRTVETDFSIGILVYYGAITDPQFNRKQCDMLAEAIETLVLADATFGAGASQLVIHSMVDSVESGYARKGNTPLRSSRLMVSAKSKNILPPNP